MIDPFFIDRLMHAFTANTTPLSHAAAQAATDQPAAASTSEPCRAVREAEAVVAEVLRRDQPTCSESPQADSHA